MNNILKLNQLVFFIVLIMTANSLCSQNNEFQKAFNKGKELYYQENYDEALKYFKIADFHAENELKQEINKWKDKCDIKLNLSSSSLSFKTNNNKNRLIQVETNALSWNYSCNQKWCRITKNESGLLINCYDNDKTTNRNAVITVTAGKKQQTITVTQIAKPKFELSRDTIYFSKDMIKDSVIVTASSWQIDSVSDGCSATISKDSNVLNVFCQKNRKTYEIEKHVYLSSLKEYKVLTIIQEASDVIFELDTREMHFNSAGGEFSRLVNTNLDYFSTHSDTSWFNVINTNTSIKVICEENNTKNTRSGKVIITHPYGQNSFVVSQDAGNNKKTYDNNYPTYKFITLNTSLSIQPQFAVGLTAGYVKKFGGFISIMTGLGFKGFSADMTSDDNGFVNGNYPLYTGKTSKSRLSIILGGIMSVTDKVYVRAGIGYGTRKVAYETVDGKWINYGKESYSGIDLSAGAQTFIKRFTLSFDLVTTSFKAMECKLGFGFTLK